MFLLVLSSNLFADALNSAQMKVTSIEARDSGSHAIYFSGNIPTQGCTNEDRAIVVETGIIGSKVLINIALSALMNQKSVVVRVEGCTLTNPNKSTNTSPKIVKLEIYN